MVFVKYLNDIYRCIEVVLDDLLAVALVVLELLCRILHETLCNSVLRHTFLHLYRFCKHVVNCVNRRILVVLDVSHSLAAEDITGRKSCLCNLLQLLDVFDLVIINKHKLFYVLLFLCRVALCLDELGKNLDTVGVCIDTCNGEFCKYCLPCAVSGVEVLVLYVDARNAYRFKATDAVLALTEAEFIGDTILCACTCRYKYKKCKK